MSDLENVDLIVASKDESFGGILKLEREKKGLSIEEVSDDLHLDRKIIYAIENHNLEDLPEPAFVCGYIRNYARFLKLQPEPIVDDFKKKVSLSADINAINSVGDLSYNRQEKRFHFLIFFLILILVGGGYFGWEFWKTNNQNTVIDSNDALPIQESNATDVSDGEDSLFKTFNLDKGNDETNNSEAEQNQVDNNSQPTYVAEAQPSGESTPVIASQTNETPSEPENNAEQNSVEQPEAEPETPEAVVEVATSELEKQVNQQSNQLIEEQKKEKKTKHQKRIKFTFAKDSWISVKDANNKSLVYDLMRAGEELELKGVVPIRVFLGDATGVSLSVEEEDFDISGYINRKNIAKFNVN